MTRLGTAMKEPRARAERLGFRVDQPTKLLVERAAELEHRNVTDYCLSALADAARRTIAQHESLVLSDADRAAFFDVLVNPPPVAQRLERAFAAERRRIAP